MKSKKSWWDLQPEPKVCYARFVQRLKQGESREESINPIQKNTFDRDYYEAKTGDKPQYQTYITRLRAGYLHSIAIMVDLPSQKVFVPQKKSLDLLEIWKIDKESVLADMLAIGWREWQRKWGLNSRSTRKLIPDMLITGNTWKSYYESKIYQVQKLLEEGYSIRSLQQYFCMHESWILDDMREIYSTNHRKYGQIDVVDKPYWMDDSVVDPDRPLKCEKTKNIRPLS